MLSCNSFWGHQVSQALHLQLRKAEVPSETSGNQRNLLQQGKDMTVMVTDASGEKLLNSTPRITSEPAIQQINHFIALLRSSCSSLK